MYRLTFALVAVAALAQQQNSVLTPERILDIRRVTTAEISPDGSRIVYQLQRARRADEKPGASIMELWMIPAAGGASRPLTWNDTSATSPRWSPDGRTIAFLSKRGAQTENQIWLLPVDGGEAQPLTKHPTAVSAFTWSPDGKSIAYLAMEEKSKAEKDDTEKGRDWTVIDQNPKQRRLHVIDVATRESRTVSGEGYSVLDFDWSPDMKQFVVKTVDAPTVDKEFMNGRLMTLPATGGEPRLIAKTEGKLAHPRWSPDGKYIAWLGATEFKDPANGTVFFAPATGGAASNLMPGMEATATAVEWVPGAPSTLAFLATERQDTVVYAIELPERNRKTLAPKGAIFFGMPSFTRDGSTIAAAASTPTHPQEVFAGSTGSAPARLTTTNAWLAQVQLGAQEIFKWKARDGKDIEGVLIKPAGYREGQRYPLVMQPHGGPESADMNGWYGSYSAWGQMLAGHGFAVFYPNYRGSTGRGVAYSMADHRDLMGKEFEDMLDGIDALVARGIVDKDRVGVGGGSYGGYTSAWAATFASERFKAAIPWMGISNWFSMTGTSDIFLENTTVHWDLSMYDPANHKIYWERSPMAYIHKAKTPALIIHGQVDTRVPIGQSQELYTALKHKGVPVEFVVYPRAGHGLTETAHQLDFMKRCLGWFEKYLK